MDSLATVLRASPHPPAAPSRRTQTRGAATASTPRGTDSPRAMVALPPPGRRERRRRPLTTAGSRSNLPVVQQRVRHRLPLVRWRGAHPGQPRDVKAVPAPDDQRHAERSEAAHRQPPSGAGVRGRLDASQPVAGAGQGPGARQLRHGRRLAPTRGRGSQVRAPLCHGVGPLLPLTLASGTPRPSLPLRAPTDPPSHPHPRGWCGSVAKVWTPSFRFAPCVGPSASCVRLSSLPSLACRTTAADTRCGCARLASR